MKIVFKFLFLIGAVSIVVISCRKDPKTGDVGGAYNPTYIKTASLYPSYFPKVSLPANNPLTEEGVYLGRMLFYDPVLSIDSSISCASCHDQKHAFADPRPFSTGVFGLKTGRNAPPLFNLAYNKVFFWDGRQKTLAEQVLEPIQSHVEMAMTLPLLEEKLKNIERYKIWFKKAFNSQPDIFNMAKALEQFQLTLISKDSRFNKFLRGDNTALSVDEVMGFNLYTKLFIPGTQVGGDCFHCHATPLAQTNSLTTGGLANNGLDEIITDKGVGGITGKSTDIGLFKTPSLLNIAVTGPFMHDGRFNTLEEVIDHYSDKVHFNSPNLTPTMDHNKTHINMSATEKAQLKALLLSMTDSVFINNPAHSNPFK